jgi:hypothetical protein
VWVNRRHLMRARQRLSNMRFAIMWNACLDTDPSGDLLATWIAKEQLRDLLGCARAGADHPTIRARLFDFYTWCAGTDVPEVHFRVSLVTHPAPAEAPPLVMAVAVVRQRTTMNAPRIYTRRIPSV